MNGGEDRIFAVVKSKVVEVLEGIDPARITPSTSLVDLGANSIDRVEVAISSMEALGLAVPVTQLHGVKDLMGLVQVFSRHCHET